MRYFIMSRGRSERQHTLQSLPEQHRGLIELVVRKDEYKDYKKGWYASQVKSIECWPDEVDFSAKKRKWFAENAGDDYVVFDDDISVYQWSHKKGTYVKPEANLALFDRYLTETVPELFKKYHAVSMANKFMANPHVHDRVSKHGKEKGLLDEDRIGYTISGFSKEVGPRLDFNQVFCYTDMFLPLQALRDYQASVVFYGLSYGHHNSKFLEETGITYRTQQLLVDSVMKLMRLFPGVVLGYRMTGKDESRMTLLKRDKRLITGITPAHKAAARTFMLTELEKQGLSRPPDMYQYSDDTPMEEIIRRIQKNWKAALA